MLDKMEKELQEPDTKDNFESCLFTYTVNLENIQIELSRYL